NIAWSVVALQVHRQPVVVAPPCGCASGPRLDVASLVAAHATSNDDARIGLVADAFAGGAGPAALDLPCGQFYLSAIKASSDLERRVAGPTALFVGGDVTLGGGLPVTLAPGAELDLVVAGDVAAQGGVVGAPSAASVRLWLASSTVKLTNGAGLSALVYA